MVKFYDSGALYSPVEPTLSVHSRRDTYLTGSAIRRFPRSTRVTWVSYYSLLFNKKKIRMFFWGVFVVL